jgi:hypothetical protein
VPNLTVRPLTSGAAYVEALGDFGDFGDQRFAFAEPGTAAA